jgi:predicted permease
VGITFAALLPVFVVILIGFALRRSGLVPGEQWSAIDHVCYTVLFPAIIFKEIAGADFSSVPVAGLALAMMLAVASMCALLLAVQAPLRRGLGLSGPQFSSLFQGATRWHTFIGLALIPVLFGPGALALGGLAAASMTPLLNVINVMVVAGFARHQALPARTIALSVLRNSFVLSSLAGVAWQMSGMGLPPLALSVLDIVGKGALGLALLAVGAGLRLADMVVTPLPVAVGTGLKLLGMPLIMAAWLHVLGVGGEAARIALLCSAVPTGSGTYVLARKLGGDAPLVAALLTAQVVVSGFTIPLVLAWLG